MISVAMTTYNSMRFIKTQLESILNQSVQADELVIVDDCSNDGTYEYLSEFIKSRELKSWKLIRNDKNIGYKRSFYKSISQTHGDIIVLCDHDDEWFPCKLETFANAFSKNKNILSLATRFIKIDTNGALIPEKTRRANNGLIRRRVREGELLKIDFKDVSVYNISPGCACAFRASLKEKLLKYYIDIPHDLYINILAAYYSGLYYLDKTTTKYRIHSQNTIGLGHKLDYNKRWEALSNDLHEKDEILRLLKLLGGEETQYYDYALKVKRIFKARAAFFKDAGQFKKLKSFATALIGSLNKNRLYESVILDLVSMLFFKR